MITDVFFKRYKASLHFDWPNSETYRFFRQAAEILESDLSSHVSSPDEYVQTACRQIEREWGNGIFVDPALTDSLNWLTTEYSAYERVDANEFIQLRLSFIEILFAAFELDVKSASGGEPSALASRAIQAAILELNHRMREAHLPLHYHNGKLQLRTEDRTQDQIHEPFWKLIGYPKWSSVDHEMKEAIDRFDNGRSESALSATKALESTIKIISHEKGWTRGNENGPANYIDNLVSRNNGRFIDPWESEQLKHLFSTVRNPHGHGSGPDPPPNLSRQQEAWVIDNAMCWIKSLVTRM